MSKIVREEDGSVTLIAAFGMVAILGFLALAIDVGQLRFEQRNLQRAADAAALASTLELSFCGGIGACATMQSAEQSAMAENGVTAVNTVTNCGTPPSTGITLSVNNGPCSQGSADPNFGKASTVEVVLSEPYPSLFASVLGYKTVSVSARAEASTTGGSSCIFALDPTGSGALTVQALATITSPCGIVVESKSSSAVSCSLLGAITATQINVVGGVSNFLCAITPTANCPAITRRSAGLLTCSDDARLWNDDEQSIPRVTLGGDDQPGQQRYLLS